MDRRQRVRWARLRRRVHFVLDNAVASDRVSAFVHRVLVALVVVSVSAVVLESVARYRAAYGTAFFFVEIAAVVAFTIEYLLRLWSAPDHTPYADLGAARARLTFMLSPAALIDLVSILPFYLGFFVPADLRVLLLLRLLRFFKLARYSPGMRSLVTALQSERKALVASGVILFGLVLLTASAMHLAEHGARPDQFGSIPDAMWWSIVTLTTVGYGDVVPVTLLGRVIAGFTMVMGLMMLALPVGIIATAFANEIHRREFVVTWGMVARVPLFAGLEANDIAEIMNYLRAQTVPTGTLIVRHGEMAQCMYFIASGAVEVELPKAPIRLSEGQFFGEIAIVRKTRRTASVRALEATKLLILDANDLAVLVARNPKLGKRIEQVAAARVEFQARNRGDILPSEMQPSSSEPPPGEI